MGRVDRPARSLTELAWLAKLSAVLLLSAITALTACRNDASEPAGEASTRDVVSDGDPRPPWLQIDRPSLAACGICHLEVHAEWAQSLHHRAWTNANVRSETDDFKQTGCRSCHSPLPVLAKGASGLDQRPDYRDFNQPDGVHCLSCHGLHDGVAASRTLADAPCRPRYEPSFMRAQMCWPCHEPTHHAFQEYERSDAFAIGLRCADCHMPTVDRAGEDGAARAGRSHGPHGGLNPDFVRRAVAWSCVREGGEIVVTLRNRTGHKFSGEIPSRVFTVKLTADDGEPQYVTMRKPGKTEKREDDRLDVDELRTLRFTVDPAARDVRVQLLFKPFPLLPDDAAFVIGEWSAPADSAHAADTSVTTTHEDGIAKVVAAIGEAAMENSVRPASERASGDALFDLYVRRACASGQPAKAVVLGLAYALEPTGIVAKNPLVAGVFESVESQEDRKARLAAMGKPTLRGREDWLAHFVVSAALLVIVGEQTAEAIAIQKEVTDAVLKESGAGSGFSFTDLGADFAGVAFAKWLLSAASRNALDACRRSFSGADFLPDPQGLADGLTWTEFEESRGGVRDPRFREECLGLRSRARGCRGYASD